jgi:hypothetical protein
MRRNTFSCALAAMSLPGAVANPWPDVDVGNPATCAGCACTDRLACAGGCYWLSVDRPAKSGICSNCRPALAAWKNQRTSQGTT